MDLGLAGRRALVTGSNSGIGADIATLLASEGAAVVIHGRNRERAETLANQLSGLGHNVAVAIGDLATDEGAAAVAREAVGALGGIDILVNNAGGRSNEGGAADWFGATPNDWAETYNMNVVSAIRMIHHLGPAMRERGWGRLIQLASATANSPNSAVAHYAAAKGAISNLTVSLAKAFARSGVTANTVSPGMIYTPALDSWFDDIALEKGWAKDRDRTQQWVLENVVEQTVARMGQVRDISAMVAFLASPLADFINGANMRVDGGRSPGVN